MAARYCKRIKVFGFVQGVGYRFFIRGNSQQLGLRGLVRNLRDGTVEIIAEGSKKQIDELVILAKRGPSFSQVSHVEIYDYNVEETKFSGFDIDY